MNCQTCGYLLWNLPPGDCPECGRPFKPSDFEFRHCAVQYACPHCRQVYYGTDEGGHLVPRHFTCVTCGHEIDMDQMVVRPDAAVEENHTARARNPWLDRRRVGWLRGWLATIGHAMVWPRRLIATTPPAGGKLEAAAFFVVTTLLYHIAAYLPLILLMVLMGAMVSGLGAGGPPLWAMLSGFGGVMLAPLAAVLVFVPLWALTAHGLLRLTGKTEHGPGRTWQALCYGSGANCALAVPCLSFYIFWIGWGWWIVSSTLMLARGQAVGGLRAAAAVLLLPVVVVGGLGAWGGVAAYRNTTFVGAAPRSFSVTRFGTQSLVTGLLAYQVQNGSPPPHATALIPAGLASVGDFLGANTHTFPADVPLGTGGKTLRDLGLANSAAKAAPVQQAAAALPPGVIAHRVGDYVFTYHGIPLNAPPAPNLWIVVSSPDPDANPATSPASTWIGMASGNVVEVRPSAFPAALQRQNQLRATHGLAPLPPPGTVTHATPAVAP